MQEKRSAPSNSTGPWGPRLNYSDEGGKIAVVMNFLPQEGNTAEEVLRRRDKMWELRQGYIPIPRFELLCPICGLPHVQLGEARWNTHYKGIRKEFRITLGYRVDLRLKCRNCSVLLWFGIPLTKEEFQLVSRDEEDYTMRWRDIKDLLDNE